MTVARRILPALDEGRESAPPGEQVEFSSAVGSTGTDYLLNVTAGEVWHPICVGCRLTTGAAAANRVLNVLFSGASLTTAQTGSNQVLTASKAADYCFSFWTLNTTVPTATNMIVGMLPDVLVGTAAGCFIRWHVDNMQAADVLSNIVLVYSRWRV